MPKTIICFRIAGIGPSDVEEDILSIREVVKDLNEEYSTRDVRVSFHHWTEIAQGLGAPQNYIDNQLNWASMDFVVGAMGQKFGTPVDDAGSGTEHECNEVMKLHKIYKRPDLLFYFKDAPSNMTIDADENEKVRQFRAQITEQGLVGTYKDSSDLKGTVKKALREKIEWKLGLQKAERRRIGELPPDRSISVEMLVSCELIEGHQTPTVAVLRNGKGEHFILDTRHMTAQHIADWISHSMGFAKTSGPTLNQYLLQANIDNLNNNTGVISQWVGNILIADYPGFPMDNIKIMLHEVHRDDNGKIGFDRTQKGFTIYHVAPQMRQNADGKWDVRI